MRGALPNRIVSFGANDGADLSDLLAAYCRERDARLAVEADAGAFAEPRVAHALDAASGLGVEVTARLGPAQAMDRSTIASLRLRSCRSITVALDGHDAATHDAYHGARGAFASSLRSLEQARHLGFGLYVASRIHRADAGQLARMAMLPRWLGAKAWFVSFAGKPGAGGGAVPLTFAERRQACVSLDDLAERHRQAIAVRCPDCGANAWVASDACVDPAEIAAIPCAGGCAAPAPISHETTERLAAMSH